MLKIKIPPRSNPPAEVLPESKETDSRATVDSDIDYFWTWWQKAFEEPEDLLEYNAGLLNSTRELAEAVKNYVWPDFMVGVEGTWVVFSE